MPMLLDTTNQKSFHRPLPAGTKFAFSSPHTTTVTFYAGSTQTTGYHWHALHTEFIRVIQGHVLLTRNNTSRVFGPEDGVVVIERGVKHEWCRWDCPGLTGHRAAAQNVYREFVRGQEEGLPGEDDLRQQGEEDLIVEDRTEPADGSKEVFFRNLFSAMQQPPLFPSTNPVFILFNNIYKTIQIMTIVWELDNPEVIWDLGSDGLGWRSVVEGAVTIVVMGSAWVIGKILGIKPVNEEWTPKDLLPDHTGRHGLKKVE